VGLRRLLAQPGRLISDPLDAFVLRIAEKGRKPSQRADFRHTASAAPAELLGTHTLMTRPTGLVGAGYSGWRPSFDPFDDDRGPTLTAKRCEDCWTSTGGQA